MSNEEKRGRSQSVHWGSQNDQERVIRSGVINIMEVLSMIYLRVLFPMVYSDLAINALILIKVIIHCNFANMLHRCTRCDKK